MISILLAFLATSAIGDACRCVPHGVGNYTAFDDEEVSANGNVTAIELHHDNAYILGVRFVYGGVPGDLHGGAPNGSVAVNITFLPNEYLYRVDGVAAPYVKQLTFHTKLTSGDRVHGPHGDLSYNDNKFTDEGNVLTYISGQESSGEFLQLWVSNFDSGCHCCQDDPIWGYSLPLGNRV